LTDQPLFKAASADPRTMADQDGGGAKQLTFKEKMAATADAMKKKAMAKADQLKKKAEAKAKELKDKKAGGKGGEKEKEREKMEADQGAGAGAGLAAQDPLKSKSKLLHVRGGAARNTESIQRMRGLSSESPEEQSIRQTQESAFRLAKQESTEAALIMEDSVKAAQTDEDVALIKKLAHWACCCFAVTALMNMLPAFTGDYAHHVTASPAWLSVNGLFSLAAIFFSFGVLRHNLDYKLLRGMLKQGNVRLILLQIVALELCYVYALIVRGEIVTWLHVNSPMTNNLIVFVLSQGCRLHA
jgi:hypothetical protein